MSISHIIFLVNIGLWVIPHMLELYLNSYDKAKGIVVVVALCDLVGISIRGCTYG